MLDVVRIENGADLGFENSVAVKAGNVLSVQQGSLEYALNFGVDLRYFFDSDLQFQNESFKAYLVQRLVEHQVNVSQVVETVQTLYRQYSFSVNEDPVRVGVPPSSTTLEEDEEDRTFLVSEDNEYLLTEDGRLLIAE